jgi:hypothetical protein
MIDDQSALSMAEHGNVLFLSNGSSTRVAKQAVMLRGARAALYAGVYQRQQSLSNVSKVPTLWE